jgi:capsid protein
MGIIIFNNGKATRSGTGYGSVYTGEKQMGDLSNMLTYKTDANAILKASYDLLSTRSMTLYHTYGPVKAPINKKTQYAIGPGLVFRSQPDWQTLGWTAEQGKEWGKRFQKIVHMYQKHLNMYKKQSVLFKTAKAAGDAFLYFERKDGLLNDIIEFSGDQIDSCKDGDNWTLGIKHDEWMRKKAIIKRDKKEISFTDEAGNQNIVQFYNKELARQLRGYPLAYSVINLARNDDTHTDAITARAVIESTIIGKMKSNGTNYRQQAGNLEDASRKAKGQEPRNALEKVGNALRFGVGNWFQMRGDGGEDVEIMKMETPGNNFDTFKSTILDYVCMCLDIPPEVAVGKYSTSFTAHKGAFNDFIKSYMMDRKAFESLVMDVVVREIAKDAILQGHIEAPGFFDGGWMVQQAYLQGMYLGPVPGHINPLVEVKADVEKVKNAFDLRSNMSAMYGNEWDNFFNEWAEEQEQFTSLPAEYQAEAVFQQETGGNGQDDQNDDNQGDDE